MGTVVRPFKEDEEAEYDFDLVCQIPIAKENTTAEKLKHMVGDRLKEDTVYNDMLDDEGRRCWTLDYAEDNDGIGFHMDRVMS